MTNLDIYLKRARTEDKFRLVGVNAWSGSSLQAPLLSLQ